jgi:hypothetical protein
MSFMETIIIYFKSHLKFKRTLQGKKMRRKMSSLTMKQMIDYLSICSINLVTMAHYLAAQFASNKTDYPSDRNSCNVLLHVLQVGRNNVYVPIKY